MLKRLNASELNKIKKFKSVLENAQRLTGVPWQALAAVWYREAGLSIAPPKTPGGQFQFDPIPSDSVFDGLLRTFTKLNKFERERLLRNGVNHFESAAVLAACWLRQHSRFVLDKDHSDEAMKDAFYGYNGRAWGPHPESSPYVYNEFDAAHNNMTIRGSIPDGKGGRKWIETTDERPGAFTVYRQLVDLKL